MDKQFSTFIHNFIKQYKKDVFNNMSKCKSLLLDHAKGEYKKEIRLLLQAFELDFYTIIMDSKDLNITRMALIKQFQDEYFISEEITTSLIDLLLLELRNYKIEQKKQVNQKKFKEINSNQQNILIQKQPFQISENNINKSVVDTDVIHELSSIISNKTDNDKIKKENERKKKNLEKRKEMYSFKRFKDKIKNVYEPAFIEYHEIMKKNGLKCKYNSLEKSIRFYFLFVNNIFKNSKATYSINKKNNDIVNTFSIFTNYRNKDITNTKDYNIKLLTKEIIINELTLFTEEILSIIRKNLDK